MVELGELLEIFGHYDADNNGRIDRAEFKRLMAALDAADSEAELDLGFDIIDANDTGTIDFAEFAEWWAER